jgi:hypothetical protein
VLLRRAISLGILILSTSTFAADAPKLVICDFEDASSLKKLDWDKNNVELTVGPRTVTETNNVLKYSVLGGDYPSFNLYPPNIPKDWSPYEVLSLVVWANNDCDLGIRVDDQKSFNYASRYNGGCRLQKGRTLVQIPIKNMSKAINIAQVKFLAFFTCNPPKGFTLWFDDILLGPQQSQKVEFIPYADRYDLVSSTEVVSPHFPLAKPLAGGPIPVFMLTSVRFGREVSEMMQRMDLKVSQLTWDREWGANTWGFGDFYGQRGHSTDYILMQRYLDSSMQGPEKFGAMMIYTPLGWNRFTASARECILKRVRDNGEGIVLMMPFPGDKDQPWPEDLKQLSALINSQTDWIRDGCEMRYPNDGRIIGKKWTLAKEHSILVGVPIEALPQTAIEIQKYEAAPGAEVLLKTEDGAPVLAVKQFGKGRVVTFATRAFSLTPNIETPQDYGHAIPYRFWEVWYSLANRSLAWAAGRDFKRDGAPVVVAPASVPAVRVAPASLPAGAEANAALIARQWKDAAGNVTDWELQFTPPTSEGTTFALTLPEAVKQGEEIKFSFTPPESAAAAKWTALLGEIVAGRWRTLERKTVDGTTVSLPTSRVRQFTAYVRVEAEKDGKRVATGKGEVIVTPPQTWNDYEVHTWLEWGLPFLREFEMERMRDFGLTANTCGPRDDSMARSLLRGGMRPHGCGLTQGLHAKDIDAQEKKYKETKSKEFLIRHPSYADADFVAKERKVAGDHAAHMAKFGPISMIMSDETALTSYTREFDFDFHPSNVAAFREIMKAQFGTIDALNAAMNISLKSFDEVQPPTSEEAKAANNFGLWNAWRAHNDDMWAGAFKMYGAALKEQNPGARLSVSGSQEQAVFNGIDWAKLTSAFDAISGYGGRFQELQRLSFHPGGLKVTPWGAYGRSGRAVDYQLWSSLTTGGCGTGLFWWYSLRNADLTFCKSGKDYQRVIREMESGLGKQYMLAKRQFCPVAFLWSANSQRAAWTQGKFDQFKKVEAEVMNALVDAELDPFFISEDAIAAGELSKRGVRAVFLPMTLSLGLGAKKGGLPMAAELQKLLDAGGAVLATDDPAFDEFLQPSKLPDALKAKLTKFADAKADLVAALAKSGAKPQVRITKPDGSHMKDVSATAHTLVAPASARAGHAFLVTILRAPVGTKDVVGADGVIRSVPDATGGKEIEPLRVDVSALGKLNVYDIRKGALLQPADGKISIDMQAGDGYPLALLPYTIDDVKVSAAVKDGNLSLSCEFSSATKDFAPHVIRVETADANGKTLRHLCANVTTAAGKGAISFPLAEEELKSAFTVRVRDVLTGKTASTQVKP